MESNLYSLSYNAVVYYADGLVGEKNKIHNLGISRRRIIAYLVQNSLDSLISYFLRQIRGLCHILGYVVENIAVHLDTTDPRAKFQEY